MPNPKETSVPMANEFGDVTALFDMHDEGLRDPCISLHQDDDAVVIHKSEWPKLKRYLEEYFK